MPDAVLLETVVVAEKPQGNGKRPALIRKGPLVTPQFKKHFDSQNVMFWSELAPGGMEC
jgi:hypothetical protein